MNNNFLNLKRRHVLGSLYGKCDRITSIPVYMGDVTEEPIGFADESLGRYVDAFVFHLPEDICKKLSTNGYHIAFDYDFSDANSRQRIKLNHFVLVSPPTAIPVPKRKSVHITEQV